MSSFPTNSTTLRRLPGRALDENGCKQANLVRGGCHRPKRRPDKNGLPAGRRCPLTRTDPPGSISVEFNDRVRKGVDPPVAILGK